MDDFPYLYRKSYREAERYGEVARWHKSHQVNIACRKDIEAAVSAGFDGERLSDGCAQSVLQRHGFKRVQYVIANTIYGRHCANQINEETLQWSQRIFVPYDRKYSSDFVVQSPLAALNLFAGQVHQAYQTLGLFGPEHCEENSRGLDFTGKVLVLSPDTLRESCWSPKNQVWVGESGFGCSPTSMGRAVYATCLGDGEKARWDRTDFVGVLKEEFLPGWAGEKLEALRGPKQAEPSMGGMS